MSALIFTREQLRAPLTIALLIGLPALFVVLASDVLGEFADALGGSLLADAATALGAGWAAAFITGALSFFQASSARGADRRLALAGLGPARVALARIASALVLALLAGVAAYVTLALTIGLEHPWHVAAGITGFALIYLGVGALVGALIPAPLEGSLLVAFIFVLDVFSGPGMTEGDGSPLSISRAAADVVISGATAQSSPAVDWVELVIWSLGSLVLAFAVFVAVSRSRA